MSTARSPSVPVEDGQLDLLIADGQDRLVRHANLPIRTWSAQVVSGPNPLFYLGRRANQLAREFAGGQALLARATEEQRSCFPTPPTS